MSEKYHIFKVETASRELWNVVRSTPYIADTPAGFSNSHIGHATTLSGAVTLAQDHAGRELSFSWSNDFQSGEGQ